MSAHRPHVVTPVRIAMEVCCAEVLFQPSFSLGLLNTLPVEDETSNALVVVWFGNRSTLRITGRDTAQTERILMRLVNTSSMF